MSNKGNAYALASAIYADTAGPIVDIDDVSERVYHVLDRSPFGSDEAKADLYAQLAEKLTAGTKFAQAVEIIEQAMDSTEAHYG